MPDDKDGGAITMYMLQEQTPDELLLRFVERLPTTIRDIILARCCRAFDRLDLDQKQNLPATFRAILLAAEGEARAYRCAKMSAVIELALHDSRLEEAALRQAGAAPEETVSIQVSLAEKHWQAAREEFLALRSRGLSLSAFKTMLVRAPAQRRPVDARN